MSSETPQQNSKQHHAIESMREAGLGLFQPTTSAQALRRKLELDEADLAQLSPTDAAIFLISLNEAIRIPVHQIANSTHIQPLNQALAIFRADGTILDKRTEAAMRLIDETIRVGSQHPYYDFLGVTDSGSNQYEALIKSEQPELDQDEMTRFVKSVKTLFVAGEIMSRLPTLNTVGLSGTGTGLAYSIGAGSGQVIYGLPRKIEESRTVEKPGPLATLPDSLKIGSITVPLPIPFRTKLVEEKRTRDETIAEEQRRKNINTEIAALFEIMHELQEDRAEVGIQNTNSLANGFLLMASAGLGSGALLSYSARQEASINLDSIRSQREEIKNFFANAAKIRAKKQDIIEKNEDDIEKLWKLIENPRRGKEGEDVVDALKAEIERLKIQVTDARFVIAALTGEEKANSERSDSLTREEMNKILEFEKDLVRAARITHTGRTYAEAYIGFVTQIRMQLEKITTLRTRQELNQLKREFELGLVSNTNQALEENEGALNKAIVNIKDFINKALYKIKNRK